MTSVATIMGAVPLVLAGGPGSASRATIGVVVIFGVAFSTLLSLYVVPGFYALLAPFTRSPEAVAHELQALEAVSYTHLDVYKRQVDRLSSLDGVARVQLGGGQRYAMRVWLDRDAMAARGVTAGDIETALRTQNIELPAGRIESGTRDFTLRVERGY